MTFEDLNEGDLVSLTAGEGKNKMTFQSKIIKIIDNSIVIDPILVDNILLKFPANIPVEMMVIQPQATPIFWQKVAVNVKIYHEKNVHVITSKLPGVKLNRRSCFRVPIGASVKMNGGPKENMNVTLKDISSSGFAVMTDKDIKLEMHKKISVEYMDNSLKKFFELSGRPIRTAEINNYNVYGCILDGRYSELDSYLNQKQMENRPNRKK